MKKLTLSLIAAMVSIASANAASTFDHNTVSGFAQDAYKGMYTLDTAYLDQQIADARQFFDTDEKHQSYIQSIKASSDYNLIRDKSISTSVSYGNASARQVRNGKWEVKFPAEIAFTGANTLRHCLSVTMNLNETETGLAVANAISTDGECLKDIKE